MAIIFFWLVLSIVVGWIGSSRKIGGGAAFFISILLSPLIGFIITIFSKDKNEEEYKQAVLKSLKNQQIQPTSNAQVSLTEELERLKKLKEEGHITDEEFQQLKQKILSK